MANRLCESFTETLYGQEVEKNEKRADCLSGRQRQFAGNLR
jgi:hypothetical protein